MLSRRVKPTISRLGFGRSTTKLYETRGRQQLAFNYCFEFEDQTCAQVRITLSTILNVPPNALVKNYFSVFLPRTEKAQKRISFSLICFLRFLFCDLIFKTQESLWDQSQERYKMISFLLPHLRIPGSSRLRQDSIQVQHGACKRTAIRSTYRLIYSHHT